ncbi:uncharacterized protein V1513DRAFT_448246 [Lipomyces chichibuensis]|uniref:uncharacterized protein n=1 Tax=Lipomyces chichibuensis TaxID=1546026 RepID=UPI003343A88A
MSVISRTIQEIVNLKQPVQEPETPRAVFVYRREFGHDAKERLIYFVFFSILGYCSLYPYSECSACPVGWPPGTLLVVQVFTKLLFLREWYSGI